MDSEKSLNPSSLLDLKAELHKKYESFRRAKLSQKPESSKPTAFKLKVELVSKDKKSAPKPELNVTKNDEEELALKKSRQALEAKAKLYEKITSDHILIDDEENEKYLVDFQRKVLYDTSLPDTTKNVNSNLVEQNNTASHSEELPKNIYCEKYVVTENQREKTVEENQTEQPVHYQNVQFNEVREHGVGYFAFSTDESKRKEQMEEINRLHREGKEQIAVNQRIQRKRKVMLEARLAKVCERRNIDKSIVQTYTKTQETDNSNEEQNVDLSSIPLPEISEEPAKKEAKVRPWDVGKTDFPAFVPEKSKIRSQNDWVKERRSERSSEFAPPSSY